MRPIILDIRTPAEFAEGHVQGAVNVPTPAPPLDQTARRRLSAGLSQALGGAHRATPLYLYCKKGVRAGIAANMLRRMGYTHVANLGGLEQEPLPSVVRRGQLAWVR